MKKFKVHLSKWFSTTVEVQADTEDAAVDLALYQLMRGEIELEGRYAHDDITVIVEEVHE